MKITKINSSTALRGPNAIDTVHQSTAFARIFPRLVSEFILAIYILAMFGVSFSIASAAQLEVHIPKDIGAGDSFVLPVSLNSGGESINAVEGNLRYPSNLTLAEIREGSSVITFWIDKPSSENNAVHFSGVTPGGFNGVGELFTLVFKANSVSTGSFSVDSARALLNDGVGTETKLSIASNTLIIANTGSGTLVPSVKESDTTPPDTFLPVVVSDQNLNDGAKVVVFATQDKGSGIDHYEVAEKRGFKSFSIQSLLWERAESPYVLKDQAQESHIYVRAIDRAGNERISILSPEHLPRAYNPAYWAGILILLALLGLIARNYVHSRKKIAP